MEEFGFSRLHGIGCAVRKKRSQTSRRPKPDSQPFFEYHDHSPSSTTPPSDDMSKGSSDENGDANFRRKEFNLNQCLSRGSASSATGSEGDKVRVRIKESGGINAFYNNDSGRSAYNNKRSSEGVLAPANWKSTSKVMESDSRSVNAHGVRNDEIQSSEQTRVTFDVVGNDNKVKKVKLKVGGVTHTIHADSTTNGSSSVKNSRLLQKQNTLGNMDEDLSVSDKRACLQGIPWKGFSRGGFTPRKEDSSMVKISGKGTSGKQGDKSEAIRKSKRVPKRRVLDGEFGEDDEDDEIRYLEKLKSAKVSAGYKEDDEEFSKKQRKLSTMENMGASWSVKDGKKKSRPDGLTEDADYEDEEDMLSDGDLEGSKKKKQKKESVDSLMEGKREMTLTTRQRALQSSRDGSSGPGANLIEFPNGLPPAPPRKQKEKLTELEQQIKKAEAAERRRMQNLNNAKKIEDEAIRKILGQDSNRKKREDKIKKRQEELAQEKAANALKLASSTIRCVMGPSGTVVTFSKDMGLPSIFDSKPCSYPPPREKCAGPFCTKPYKYRDSKSMLPLCSLQCYKAVQEQMMQAGPSC